MTSTQSGEDVIDLLLRQHGEIRELFSELEVATCDQRRDAFRSLVRLLAVHETAEEDVVHPAARTAKSAEAIEARLIEEREAKEMLSRLDEIGPDAKGFDTLLLQFRDDVLAHAEHEEREEIPRLRASCDADQLRRMALAVRAAEAVAQTRPHPGVESHRESPTRATDCNRGPRPRPDPQRPPALARSKHGRADGAWVRPRRDRPALSSAPSSRHIPEGDSKWLT